MLSRSSSGQVRTKLVKVRKSRIWISNRGYSTLFSYFWSFLCISFRIKVKIPPWHFWKRAQVFWPFRPMKTLAQISNFIFSRSIHTFCLRLFFTTVTEQTLFSTSLKARPAIYTLKAAFRIGQKIVFEWAKWRLPDRFREIGQKSA